MRIDLSKDPMFGRKQSPVKELKQKRLEKQKQLRIKRMNPNFNGSNRQSLQQIVDPLPLQLRIYREQTQIKPLHDYSKARKNLKKYIIEQERNLKYLRLDRLEEQRPENSKRNTSHKLNLFDDQSKQSQNEQIHIPKISELFKNQEKQYVLYQSRKMKNDLARAISSIDEKVNDIKALILKSINNTKPLISHKDSKRSTSVDQKFNLTTRTLQLSAVNDQQDLQLNDLIEKKLQKSLKLRNKLYSEKKQMMSNITKQDADQSNFFLVYTKKPRKKVMLEGIKHVKMMHNDKEIQLTPASTLLFELNRLHTQRQKKQHQLSGLIKNSYQNREDILAQKQKFYEQQSIFRDLSPSSQFKLRKQMNRRLQKRLQLSKQQARSFISYITKIKQQYHVILNNPMLQILQQIRQALINQKTMKVSDFDVIINSKDTKSLKEGENSNIIKKLYEMMV